MAEVRVNEKFWSAQLPIALLAAALLLAASAWRAWLRFGRDTSALPSTRPHGRASLSETARAAH
jgi:hypothetical protein